MEATSRKLCYWLITAFLEKGVDPLQSTRSQHRQPTARSRPLNREEQREFLRPSVNVHFLPHPRRSSL